MKITKWLVSKTAWAALLGLVLTMGASGQGLNLAEVLAKDSSVTVGTLPNGLTYYIKPNGKPAGKVELRLVVKAGSILENDDQQGLAHFMEHMEFNGSEHYPKNQLVDYLQKIGVRFGSDLNANTGWDRTYYLLPVPTDGVGNLENGFRIVADWAGGASIAEDEVKDERKVILEESRMRSRNAQTRMFRQYLPYMLNGSRYADRLPIGLDSIVAHADARRIRAFYHDWYRPDLMAVLVVGDISVAAAKTLLQNYFGLLKGPVNERGRIYYNVAPYSTKKAMVVTDAEATDYAFTLMYPAHKRTAERTVGDFRNELIKDIFEQSVNRKLRDMAQGSNPPFREARLRLRGNFEALTLLDEGMQLDVFPMGDLRKAMDSAIGVLLAVRQYGITEQDLVTAKAALLARYETGYKERNSMPSAGWADVFAGSFMRDEPVVGIANRYRYVQELLPTITVRDIDVLGQETINAPASYFALVTGPSAGKMDLPSADGLKEWVAAAFGQTAERFRQRSDVAGLLEREPVPGRIVAETRDVQLGATTYTLSNGVKVTVKPTEFQRDEVLFNGVKYGGADLYGVADRSNTGFLGAVIGTMGYGQFTPAVLSDYLAGRNVSVKLAMGRANDEIGGGSSVKDMETLMKLIYLDLTAPRRDTGLLSGWLKKEAVSLPLLMRDPQHAFNDSLNRYLYHDDPLAPIAVPTRRDLDNIDVDRVLAIYKEQFGNADGFHFFFVGNIDTNNIKPLLEKYIASLPAEGMRPKCRDNGLRLVTGDRTLRFYKGTDQKSLVIDMYHGDIPYTDDLPLKATMLAQAMTIRVMDTIREKRQWIYSGSVTASVQRVPYGYYRITAQLPCGPENVDHIFRELDKEAAVYRERGVAETDLAKVKQALIEQYRVGIKENRTWLVYLQQVLFFGTPAGNILNFEQRVNRVTSADLKDMAKRLLGGNHFRAASFPAPRQ